MKIIYIANSRIPTEKAHGHQICQMCSEFARLGAEVELWLPTKNNNIKPDVFTYYKIKKTFKVRIIRSYDFIRLDKFLFNRSYWLQSLNFSLKMLFERIQPEDMVYTRDILTAFTLSLRGRRVSYECHSLMKYTWLLKILSRPIKKIIVLTQGIKSTFISLGHEEKDIMIGPDAVDIEKFDLDLNMEQARVKLNLPQEKKILGFTGSFTTMNQDKGIKDILRALKIIIPDEKNILFIAIGGNKKDMDFYQRMADEMEVGQYVKLVSKVSQEEVAVYQKAFNILLMPFPHSRHYAYFMSPLKMFEYMVSGRVIVTSDLPSIREVLNENNCLFCQPDDPASLAMAIIKADNKILADKLSAQAYQDVKNYTWEKRARNIINFIKID